MPNVLSVNYSVLLLLPRFIIFTARWLKPNLNKYFKRIPTSIVTSPFLVLLQKTVCSSRTLMFLLLCISKFYDLLYEITLTVK